MTDWKAWERINQAHSLMASITACPDSTCQRHGAASAVYLEVADPHLPEVGVGVGGRKWQQMGQLWGRVGRREREVEEGLGFSL